MKKRLTLKQIKDWYYDPEENRKKEDLISFLQKNGPFQEIQIGPHVSREYIVSIRMVGAQFSRKLKAMGLVQNDPRVAELKKRTLPILAKIEIEQKKIADCKLEIARLRAKIKADPFDEHGLSDFIAGNLTNQPKP
jgi:hypothetical protein